MEYKLDTQEDLAASLTQLYKNYGKTIPHIYLLKTILYEFKYDLNRDVVSGAEIEKRIIEYQDIISDEFKMADMFEKIFKKAEANQADIVADSFAEFVLISQADAKLRNVMKFHKKHKNYDEVSE